MKHAPFPKRARQTVDRGVTPPAIEKIRRRRNWLIHRRVEFHLAADWEKRYERDYGRRARRHAIPSWQLLPYCDA